MKTTFNTGNFTLAIDGEFSADQREKALESALRYIVQRDGASKAYAIIAGEKGENGKVKLPKDFVRDSVEYSEENAAAMRDAFETALAPYGDFSVTASKNEGGEAASPMKRATAFVDALLDDGEKETQMRSLFSLQGMTDAADADREVLIAFANSKGLGIQPPKEKKA